MPYSDVRESAGNPAQGPKRLVNPNSSFKALGEDWGPLGSGFSISGKATDWGEIRY